MTQIQTETQTQTQTLIQRSMSLCLAAVLTLAMLGGIDHLAQQDDQPANWAQNTTVRA